MVSRAKPSKLDLNEATQQELIDLAGLPKRVAEAILKRREERGPYTSFDELADIEGLGKDVLERLRGTIEVATDVGQAAAEQGREQIARLAEVSRDNVQRLAGTQAEAVRSAADAAAGLGQTAAKRSGEIAARAVNGTGRAAGDVLRVGTLWFSYWPEQVGENLQLVNRLATCRNWHDAVELHGAYVQSSLQRLADRVTSTVDLLASVGRIGIGTAQSAQFEAQRAY